MSSLLTLVKALSYSTLGAWSSGGGEFVRDGANPWFVKNTSIIHYCTMVDTSSVSLTEGQVDPIIQKAASYWNRQFKKASFQDKNPGIGTQKFVKKNCSSTNDPSVDIYFQFGFLSEEQKTSIPRPRRFASIAVRTHYDERKLRGKGFIYYGAEQGPLKMDANSSRAMKKPWTEAPESILYWTTVHELGHVFGLPHTKAGIMATDFVERLLDTGNTPEGSDHHFVVKSSHQSSEKVRYMCFFEPLGNHIGGAFLGAPPQWSCLGTKLNRELEVWAAPNIDNLGSGYRLGRISIVRETISLKEAVSFWFPKDQEIFSQNERISLPSYQVREISGSYQTDDGIIVRPVGIVLDPREKDPLLKDLKISGLFRGVFYVNLFHSFH